ncbi:MAG TPA: hypothetical protein VGZ93_01035 [Candidatus Methylacidiphilales bacterium]|jgi:hypothetical protein|nr:hypothetical protein [Candidatus Methylacidiphilales bacterium]
MAEPLQIELETYTKKLPELLERAGQFALIKGTDVIGIYSAYADALQEGYKLFKTEPFLVQQIQSSQPIHYFSRELLLCPS